MKTLKQPRASQNIRKMIRSTAFAGILLAVGSCNQQHVDPRADTTPPSIEMDIMGPTNLSELGTSTFIPIPKTHSNNSAELARARQKLWLKDRAIYKVMVVMAENTACRQLLVSIDPLYMSINSVKINGVAATVPTDNIIKVNSTLENPRALMTVEAYVQVQLSSHDILATGAAINVTGRNFSATASAVQSAIYFSDIWMDVRGYNSANGCCRDYFGLGLESMPLCTGPACH